MKHGTIYVAETTLAQVILAAIRLTLHESQQEQCLQIINILAFAFSELLFLCRTLAPNLLPMVKEAEFLFFSRFYETPYDFL